MRSGGWAQGQCLVSLKGENWTGTQAHREAVRTREWPGTQHSLQSQRSCLCPCLALSTALCPLA